MGNKGVSGCKSEDVAKGEVVGRSEMAQKQRSPSIAGKA